MIHRELLKRCPNDPVIEEFGDLLPDEVETQKYNEKVEADEQEEYEYEDEEEEESESSELSELSDEKDDEDKGSTTTATTKQEQPKEEEKKGDDTKKEVEEEKSYSSDSDYDSDGKYIWGKEGDDWEFYYEEDKIAWEKGDYSMPDPLNVKQMNEKDFEERQNDRLKMYHSVKAIIEEDGEPLYRQKKKQGKPQKRVGGGFLQK